MNCTEAKKIPIIGFLASQGKHPVEIRNGQAVFHSPFKEDKTPSLYVDYKKYSLQVWKDFSSGAGGNILDLVMKMYNVDITGALIILQKPEIAKTDFSFFSQQKTNQSNIEIKHVQPLQNRALIQYLNSRKISQSKAAIYVQEAYYFTYEGQIKPFFALAFKNDKGGFEFRNGVKTEKFPKGFKGGNKPKWITTISHHNKTSLNIFEGFINFLSALEHFKATTPNCTTIVLNTKANLKHVIPLLKDYDKINLFLDNDKTGNQPAETVKFNHSNVTDYAKIIYRDFNDFNDFLIKYNH